MEPSDILLEGRPRGRELLEDNSLIFFVLLYDGTPLLPLDNDGSDFGIGNIVSPSTGSAFDVGLDCMGCPARDLRINILICSRASFTLNRYR